MAIPMERVEGRILTIRGHRVMLDADLAELYGVPAKALNQAIKRNAERFPDDFMFQLSREEANSIRPQTVTLKTVPGKHWKYLPYVFTEHGARGNHGSVRGGSGIELNRGRRGHSPVGQP